MVPIQQGAFPPPPPLPSPVWRLRYELTLGGGEGGPPAYWLVHLHFQLENELPRADFPGRPRDWIKVEWSGVEWSGVPGLWRGGAWPVAGGCLPAACLLPACKK